MQSKGVAPTEAKQPFAAMDLSALPVGRRDRRRVTLLRVTMPLVIAVWLAGLWMIALFLWTNVATTRFLAGEQDRAESAFARQAALTSRFPEPWLGAYNLGTALLAGGQLQEGTALLRQAFEGVPKAAPREDGGLEPFAYECSVRVNLSAGLEMQGDLLDAKGEAEQGAAFYKEALEWVSPCELQSGSSAGESADQGDDGTDDAQEQIREEEQLRQGNEAGDRLRDKLRETEETDESHGGGAQNNSGDSQSQNEPQDFDPFASETPEERERREELEERNRRHDEQQREQEESSGFGSGGGW